MNIIQEKVKANKSFAFNILKEQYYVSGGQP
jgi:hypothetical protein